MFAPGTLDHWLSNWQSPGEALFSFLASLTPLVFTSLWFWVFLITYRTAGRKKNRLFWLLVLLPFVLCYPAWMGVIWICATFFNWCGGPPL